MYKDFDFTTTKPVSQVPALQKLKQTYQKSQQQDDLLSFLIPMFRSKSDKLNEKTMNTIVKKPMIF